MTGTTGGFKFWCAAGLGLVGAVALAAPGAGGGTLAVPPLAQAVAQIDWPRPLNPMYVALGDDQVLLFTRTGAMRWDTRANRMEPVPTWPCHTALATLTEPGQVDAGRVLAGEWHDAADRPVPRLALWNGAQRAITTTLDGAPGRAIQRLVTLDERHVLVCMVQRQGNEYPYTLIYSAQIAQADAGRMQWLPAPVPAVQQALRVVGVRGEVEGWGTLVGGDGPMAFSIDGCAWRVAQPPPAWRGVTEGDIDVEWYRLPDGRPFIARMGRRTNDSREDFPSPLLWNPGRRQWDVAEQSDDAYFRSASPWSRYITDLPWHTPGAHLLGGVQLLNPATGRWINSRQRLPDSYSPVVLQLEPGRSGLPRLAVLERDTGRAYLLDVDAQPAPGTLASPHGAWGQVPLAGGDVLLAGSGGQWGARVQRIDTRHGQAQVLAPVPLPLAEAPASGRPEDVPPLSRGVEERSGLALPDGGALVFGGRGVRCEGRDSDAPGCAQAAPSYRYRLAQDAWTPEPTLRVHHATGWPWGETYIAGGRQAPRRDVLRRADGSLVWLGAERHLRGWGGEEPTRLMRWHPGHGQQALASLPSRRQQATLLELPRRGSARAPMLVAVGGRNDEEPLRSTEVYDDSTRRWRPGPTAHHRGGGAVLLANGRVFKLAQGDIGNGASAYVAEVADAAFTRWQRLPAPPAPRGLGPQEQRQWLAAHALLDVVAAGNRVYLLHNVDAPGADRRLRFWDDDQRRWRYSAPWPQGRPAPITMVPLPGRRALWRGTETFDVLPEPR